MQTVIPRQPGEVYHLYNRGVNRTDIFLKDHNHAFFMQLYTKHLVPVAKTFAYCLMANHFHPWDMEPSFAGIFRVLQWRRNLATTFFFGIYSGDRWSVHCKHLSGQRSTMLLT